MPISAIPSCFCNRLLYECHYLHVKPWKKFPVTEIIISETMNVQGNDQVILKVFDTIKIQLLQLLIIYDSQIY